VRRAALAAAAVLLLAGCGGSKEAAQTTTTTVHGTAPHGCVDVNQPPPGVRKAPKPTKALDPSKTYDVAFTTNCGVFTIRLDVKQAPKTAASFANLVQHGFFDRTVFHRIAVGFARLRAPRQGRLRPAGGGTHREARQRERAADRGRRDQEGDAPRRLNTP
jgi:hypothetical protein